MAFLNIGAVSAIPCVTPNAAATEPERGGADVRAFAGNLRSTVRWTKRQWTVETIWLSASSADAILTAIAARPVNVSGDITGGSTVPCVVNFTGGAYRKGAGGANPKRKLTLSIREA